MSSLSILFLLSLSIGIPTVYSSSLVEKIIPGLPNPVKAGSKLLNSVLSGDLQNFNKDLRDVEDPTILDEELDSRRKRFVEQPAFVLPGIRRVTLRDKFRPGKRNLGHQRHARQLSGEEDPELDFRDDEVNGNNVVKPKEIENIKIATKLIPKSNVVSSVRPHQKVAFDKNLASRWTRFSENSNGTLISKDLAQGEVNKKSTPQSVSTIAQVTNIKPNNGAVNSEAASQDPVRPVSEKANKDSDTPASQKNSKNKSKRLNKIKLELRQNLKDFENLLNVTENLVKSVNYVYNFLAQVEDDNKDHKKYAISVNLFLFLQYFLVTQSNYDETYTLALSNLKKMRTENAVQFASPVRRALNIFKAVIDTQVDLVQRVCKPATKSCLKEYYAALNDEIRTCPHALYHAYIFAQSLKYYEDNKVFNIKKIIEASIEESNLKKRNIEPYKSLMYNYKKMRRSIKPHSFESPKAVLSYPKFNHPNDLLSINRNSKRKIRSIDIDEKEEDEEPKPVLAEPNFKPNVNNVSDSAKLRDEEKLPILSDNKLKEEEKWPFVSNNSNSAVVEKYRTVGLSDSIDGEKKWSKPSYGNVTGVDQDNSRSGEEKGPLVASNVNISANSERSNLAGDGKLPISGPHGNVNSEDERNIKTKSIDPTPTVQYDPLFVDVTNFVESHPIGNDFSELFDHLIDRLQRERQSLRIYLEDGAKIFHKIKKWQIKGLLSCFAIDRTP